MPVVFDFVEDPSCLFAACAGRPAPCGSLGFLLGGKRNEARANDDECREGKWSFLGDVMEQPSCLGGVGAVVAEMPLQNAFPLLDHRYRDDQLRCTARKPARCCIADQVGTGRRTKTLHLASEVCKQDVDVQTEPGRYVEHRRAASASMSSSEQRAVFVPLCPSASRIRSRFRSSRMA